MIRCCWHALTLSPNWLPESKPVNGTLERRPFPHLLKHKLSTQPKLVDIIAGIPEQYKAGLLPLSKLNRCVQLQGCSNWQSCTKPHRCLTSPWPVTFAFYCPGGPDSDFEYSPRRTLVTNRPAWAIGPVQPVRTGPQSDRAAWRDSVIPSIKSSTLSWVATFMALDEDYRDYFVRRLHDALTGPHQPKCRRGCGIFRTVPGQVCRNNYRNPPGLLPKPIWAKCFGTAVLSRNRSAKRLPRMSHVTQSAVKHRPCRLWIVSTGKGLRIQSRSAHDARLPNVGLERDLFGFREYFENPCSDRMDLKYIPPCYSWYRPVWTVENA